MFRIPVPLNPEQLQMIALLIDAQAAAQSAKDKLDTMFNEIGNDDLAHAVDALSGIEAQIHYVAIAMRRVAELDRLYPIH